MENWGKDGHRPSDWDAAVYTQDWLNYTNVIGPEAIGPSDMSFWEPFFQAGVFEGLSGTSFNYSKNTWNAEYILKQGIASTGRVKSISTHDVRRSQVILTKPIWVRTNAMHLTRLETDG